jgi:death-on-curing protein
VRIVSLEAVLWFHDRAIGEFGGFPGVLDLHCLASAVERPRAGFGDVELYPTLFLKAAAVAHAIATGHPFLDGNKRTAILVAGATLRLNGYEPSSTTSEEVQTMLALATGDIGLEQFAAWLDEHSFALADTSNTNERSP